MVLMCIGQEDITELVAVGEVTPIIIIQLVGIQETIIIIQQKAITEMGPVLLTV